MPEASVNKPSDSERKRAWEEMLDVDDRVAKLEREMAELRERLEQAIKRAAAVVR